MNTELINKMQSQNQGFVELNTLMEALTKNIDEERDNIDSLNLINLKYAAEKDALLNAQDRKIDLQKYQERIDNLSKAMKHDKVGAKNISDEMKKIKQDLEFGFKSVYKIMHKIQAELESAERIVDQSLQRNAALRGQAELGLRKGAVISKEAALADLRNKDLTLLSCLGAINFNTQTLLKVEETLYEYNSKIVENEKEYDKIQATLKEQFKEPITQEPKQQNEQTNPAPKNFFRQNEQIDLQDDYSMEEFDFLNDLDSNLDLGGNAEKDEFENPQTNPQKLDLGALFKASANLPFAKVGGLAKTSKQAEDEDKEIEDFFIHNSYLLKQDGTLGQQSRLNDEVDRRLQAGEGAQDKVKTQKEVDEEIEKLFDKYRKNSELSKPKKEDLSGKESTKERFASKMVGGAVNVLRVSKKLYNLSSKEANSSKKILFGGVRTALNPAKFNFEGGFSASAGASAHSFFGNFNGEAPRDSRLESTRESARGSARGSAQESTRESEARTAGRTAGRTGGRAGARYESDSSDSSPERGAANGKSQEFSRK